MKPQRRPSLNSLHFIIMHSIPIRLSIDLQCLLPIFRVVIIGTDGTIMQFDNPLVVKCILVNGQNHPNLLDKRTPKELWCGNQKILPPHPPYAILPYPTLPYPTLPYPAVSILSSTQRTNPFLSIAPSSL